MSRHAGLKGLHGFIQQRLTAALEDIFRHLEKTISKYEEELLLDTVLSLQPNPELQTTEVQQLVIKEEVPSEHQWSSGLVQQEPEQPHIKEEKDATMVVLTHVPEEKDATMVVLTHVLKKEENESVDNREAELPASSSTDQFNRAAAADDEEDCEGPETDWTSGSGSDGKTSHPSEAETESKSGGGKETRTPRTDVSVTNVTVSVIKMGCKTASKRFICSKCGRRFGQKFDLQVHMRCHTGEKPFSCSECGHQFTQKSNLTKHMTVHTKKNPCVCPVCGETFSQRGHLSQHMTVHMREKVARQ